MTTPRRPAEIESAVSAICRHTLDVDELDRDEDFLSVGGYSLMVTEIAAQIRAELDVEVPIGTMLGQGSVATLAAQVTELVQCSPPGSPARTSPPPGGGSVSRKASAVDYGPTSWRVFAYYDPRCSSWRTSPPSAGATAVSTEYSATWPKQGMTRHGIA